jgi:hypothetical protein
MMPEDLTTIERRLRDAYTDAAATVQQHDLNPNAQPAMPPSRPGRGRRGLLVSLAAAAAVLLIAIAPLAIFRSPHPGPQRQHPTVPASEPVPTPTLTSYPGQATAPPRYLVTLDAVGSGLLEVRNAVTGALTASISVPTARGSCYWYALAAQGPRTFIASEDITLPSSASSLMPSSVSYFYRIAISSHGTVTSISRAGPVVQGAVAAASATPDGRYVGYLLMTSYGKNNNLARLQVVLANLATGKVLASWPVPASDSIASLSIDAGGNALAISAYYYSNYNFHTTYPNARKHADLVQWTSVLRPATSGTPIGKLPKLLPQAGTLALSPDGGTLYEFLQAGHVTGASFRDPDLVTFDLAAINARSGAVVFVLHTWQAVWADFIPQLSLSPPGGYLLIADNTSLARINAATGQYTALPTIPSIPSVGAAGKFPPDQSGAIDPLAW